jgi:hypothetical protein
MLKYDFLEIIMSHEHLVSFSHPFKSGFLFEKLSSISTQFRYILWFKKRKFILPYILIKNVSSEFSNNSEELRFKALLLFLRILEKHELDPRFKDDESFKRIFSMYFPFILSVCDHHENFFNETNKKNNSFSLSETNIILIIMMFILKYMDRTILINWLQKETEARRSSFLNCLKQAILNFVYCGKDATILSLSKGLRSMNFSDTAKKYIENAHKITPGSVNLREYRSTLKVYGSYTSTWQKSDISKISSLKNPIIEVNDVPNDMASQLEYKRLCFATRECGAIVLHALNAFIDSFRSLERAKSMDVEVLRPVVNLIGVIIEKNGEFHVLLQTLKLLGKIILNVMI